MSEHDDAVAIVAGALGCRPGDVPAEAAVGSLGGWDSIAHVTIIMAVEERIGRPMSTDEIAGFGTVADLTPLLVGARS